MSATPKPVPLSPDAEGPAMSTWHHSPLNSSGTCSLTKTAAAADGAFILSPTLFFISAIFDLNSDRDRTFVVLAWHPTSCTVSYLRGVAVLPCAACRC